MKYIVESKSIVLINKIIDKIRSAKNIETEDVLVFDFEESGYDSAFSEYLTDDLFGNKKLIHIKSSTFLNEKSPNKNKVEYLTKIFESEPNNILVLSIDKKVKTGTVFGKFKDSFEIIEYGEPKGKELEDFITKYLTNNEINFKPYDVKELVAYCDDKFEYAINELNKIKMVTKDITNGEWKDIVYDYTKQNVFEIVKSIYTKDGVALKEQLIKLKEQGQPLFLTLSFIISDLTLAISVKLNELNKTSYSTNPYELSKQTGINSFRLKKMTENIRDVELKELIKIFDEVNKIQNDFRYSEVSETAIMAKLLLIK